MHFGCVCFSGGHGLNGVPLCLRPPALADGPEGDTVAAAPEVTDTVAAPEVTDTVAAPEVTDTVAATKVTDTVAAPKVTDTVAAPKVTDTVAEAPAEVTDTCDAEGASIAPTESDKDWGHTL